MTLGKYQLMEQCQAAGVPAMPVQSTEDRVEHDPQLRHRRLHIELEHPALGSYKMQNAPFQLSASPAANHLSGPMIGQHNQEVFEGLLGLTHKDFVSGFEEGIFWPNTMDRYPYMEEMLQKGLDGLKEKNGLSRQWSEPSAHAEIGQEGGEVNAVQTREKASAGPLPGAKYWVIAQGLFILLPGR